MLLCHKEEAEVVTFSKQEGDQQPDLAGALNLRRSKSQAGEKHKMKAKLLKLEAAVFDKNGKDTYINDKS